MTEVNMTEIDRVNADRADIASQKEANRILAFLEQRAVEPEIAPLAVINAAAVMIGRAAQGNEQRFATILRVLTNILRQRARDVFEICQEKEEEEEATLQ
jgi:tRNA-dihydrouridine synthase